MARPKRAAAGKPRCAAIPKRQTNGLQAVHMGADYTDDELAFMQAMDRYKRENRRPFPTWREVLAVLTSLGYHKP